MPSSGQVLDTDDMKEAVADWVERKTGVRPDLNKVTHFGCGDGHWYFETSAWRPSTPLKEPKA